MSQTLRRAVNLADVAKRAGVSSQTVSRVVRGSDLVAKSTRDRVRAALDELGYQPNLAARTLSQRRTNVIHVLNATPLFHGHARIYLEILTALGQLGFHTSNSILPAGADLTLNNTVPLGVDGIIVLGGDEAAQSFLSMFGDRAPVVFVGRAEQLPSNVSGISVDNELGATLAVQHLLKLGRTNLCHVAGPSDWLDAKDRATGFVASCEAAGVSWSMLDAAGWDAEYGYGLAHLISPEVDAIFTGNDHLALGVLRRLHETGRGVPKDVALMGFDDAAGAGFFWPPLSTVRQPYQALGQTAVQLLSAMLAGEPAQRHVLKPELVIRESTKGNLT